MKQPSKPVAKSARRNTARGALRTATKSALRIVPRNPVSRSPLLRKGGPHEKSGGAERKGARDALRKALRKADEE